MTARPRPASRICPACDGFASAAITLGGRTRAGHLRTITVHCSKCLGTGTLTRRSVVLAGGRA
ncbi:hypothetical protein [Streptomyces sp. NPDC058247]|uniref:hypothetical protein n=1 Tax=Streptomyces sp. NPDC058247 TaxID=3346401 RepID=UPI0036E80615